MEKQFNGYNKKLKYNSRMLRKNMTYYEKKLWYQFLKNHPFKFYKQRSIDLYIADFYCSKAKLIIELDGNHHQNNDIKEYDQIRTDIINAYGINVIRFSNDEIENDFIKVCKTINSFIYRQL